MWEVIAKVLQHIKKEKQLTACKVHSHAASDAACAAESSESSDLRSSLRSARGAVG